MMKAEIAWTEKRDIETGGALICAPACPQKRCTGCGCMSNVCHADPEGDECLEGDGCVDFRTDFCKEKEVKG
jgi:hypothetical protein